MTTVPYSSQTISGYNASPPPDDGSQTTNNKVTWAGIKTKLADPNATLSAAINSQAITAFTNSVSGLDNLNVQASTTVDQLADYLPLYDASAGGNVKLIYRDLPLPRGHIGGFTLSNDAGTPTTKLDIAAGQACDSTAAITITSASQLVVDFTTTGANALDAGTIAGTTTYHIYVIRKLDNTTAGLASLSATTPTMPSGYLYKRRVGSVRTDGSSHIISFNQYGDEFWWAVQTHDINNGTNSGTAATIALTIPAGLSFLAICTSIVSNGTGILFTNLAQTDVAPTSTGPGQISPLASGGCQFFVRTNTSSQVRVRMTGSTGNYDVWTFGWIDRRGKDD